MKFLQELYLGEHLGSKADRMLENIMDGKAIPNLYLLAMSNHPDNMLEMIPEWEILQKGYPKEELRIVGIAKGRQDAFKLVQFIIEESMEKIGTADIRAYLESKWEGQI